MSFSFVIILPWNSRAVYRKHNTWVPLTAVCITFSQRLLWHRWKTSQVTCYPCTLGMEPKHTVIFYLTFNKKEGSTQLGNKTAQSFSGKVKCGTQPADSTELLQVATSVTKNNWREEHQHRIQKGSLSGRVHHDLLCQGHCIRGELHIQNNQG